MRPYLYLAYNFKCLYFKSRIDIINIMKGKPLFISLILFAAYSLVLITFSFLHFGLIKTISGWLTGMLAFTLTEYLFHRYFFHMKTGTALRKNIQLSVHGDHHIAPGEITAIMMKPQIAIVILPVISLLFYVLFGWYALALLPGFLFGYSCYLFVHFAIHNFRPPKSILRYLWKHHNLHHYFDNSKNFGVSSPLWDIIFNTHISGKANSNK
jgi:4-hydroxysphinganine ceramide fatty acyl 2-hydroxylase